MIAQPKISVVSGYFNRASAASASIESILRQDYKDFEFIVFDDASTDDTLAVLNKFKDPRIRLVAHAKNIGFVNGMIHAVAHARGKYIAVHGSGDVSHPERLARQVSVLERDPAIAVVGCYYRTVDTDGSVVKIHTPEARGVTYEDLLRENVFSHGEVMFRKDMYTQVGGYRAEFKYCQDYDLWVRMRRVGRFDVVPEVLYTRVARADGVSYRPEKVVEQAQYWALVRELAQADPSNATSILEQVRSGGVSSVVGLDHPTVVRKLSRKVAVLGAMRRWEDAKEVVRRVQGTRSPLYYAMKSFVEAGSLLDVNGRVSTAATWAFRRLRSRGTSTGPKR